MKNMKRMLVFIIAVVMVSALLPNTAEAATKVKLNKTKATLTITDIKKNPTTTLKLKGVTNKVAKKAKWSTSKKSVATVKQGKVTAKSAGKATITCKVNGKKYTCKVTVVDKRSALKVTLKNTVTNGILSNGWTEYTINNKQIVVTYNGKDVTKKAEYRIQLSENEYLSDYKAFIDSKGVLSYYACCAMLGENPKLIITYNGKKKTIPLKVTRTTKYFNECYCGERFYDDDDCIKWIEHMKTSDNHIDHEGYYIVPYYVYDVIEVK